MRCEGIVRISVHWVHEAAMPRSMWLKARHIVIYAHIHRVHVEVGAKEIELQRTGENQTTGDRQGGVLMLLQMALVPKMHHSAFIDPQ